MFSCNMAILSLSLSLCFEFCDDNILFLWCVAAELSLVLSPKQTVRCLHFLLAYCDEIAALLERERERVLPCVLRCQPHIELD